MEELPVLNKEKTYKNPLIERLSKDILSKYLSINL
jgi:hypothetical protein